MESEKCYRKSNPFQVGFYDEFADKMGMQSFIADKFAKFADEILLHDQKGLVFEAQIFPGGGGHISPEKELVRT